MAATKSGEESTNDGEEYFVETILKKKLVDGKALYLVKWIGWDSPTWEPEKNLTGCDELLAAFENMNTAATKEPRKKKKGFDRGFSPERIIGATDTTGKLMFLIKWKHTDEVDMVTAEEANTKCPQVVIKFYEERLSFESKHQSPVPN